MEPDAHFNENSGRIWNSLFVGAFTVNLIIHFCTMMLTTLTAKYADYLGASETIVGMVTGIFAITALIFKLFSVPAIDTFNRKYVLLASTGVIFIAMVCYSISATVPMLIFSRLLVGVGIAFSTTCCLTIASDSLPADKMSTGIGYFALTTAISQSISPAAGLKLVEVIGYNYTFAALAGIVLLGVVFALRIKMPFKGGKKYWISLDTVIAKECIVAAFIQYLLSMAYFAVFSFLVLFAEGRGIGSEIGVFFTVYAITLLFTRPLIGRLADKYGSVKLMLPSMLCFAMSYLIISYSYSLSTFLLAGFVSAFGFGGCQPVIQAVALKSVPRERRGAASCTCYIGNDLGTLTGSVLAGAIAEKLGFVLMWRIMLLPIFLAMLVCICFRHRIAGAGEQFTQSDVSA